MSEAEEQYMKRIKYRQVIGSLLWLSITTRPTISKFVSVASQYLIRPRKQHWKHVQSILRHLKATRNAGLVYRASNDNQLTCFTDADWAGDKVNRKSTSGVMLQLSGAAILWRSELQNITARSVFESELIALYVGTADIIWLSDLYEFYTGNALNIPTYIDNQDVVTRSQELKTSQRNRHMGIRMNCLCEVFEAERFHPLKIASELNPADGLTKLLSGRKFSVSYEQMMNDPIVEESSQDMDMS
jgi:hypothetical protein